jgi:hypothetical protein
MDPQHVCSDCGARQDDAGDCAACGEGPLLDLGDAATRETLGQIEQQRRVERERKLLLLTVPIAIGLGGAIGFVVPSLPIPYGGPLTAILAMVVTGLAIRRLLVTLFPGKKRFPFLGETITESVRADAAAIRRGTAHKPLLALAGLCVVGLAIGGFAWYAKYRDAQASLHAGQAWANLEVCAIGGPLEGSESLLERRRRIQLGGDDGDWPARCSEHAQTLFDAIDARIELRPLSNELRERFGCGKPQGCTVDQPWTQLDGLAATVAQAGFPPVAASAAPPAMIAARFLGKDAFATLGSNDDRIQDRDLLPSGGARLLVNSRRDGLRICDLHPDADDPFRCHDTLRLEGASSSIRLVRGEPTLSMRISAKGEQRFWSEDGSEVEAHDGVRDGFVLERGEGDRYRLGRVVGGELDGERKLDLSKTVIGIPELFAGQLIVVQRDGDGAALSARRLGADGDPLLEGERRIDLPVASAPTARCQSGDDAVLLFGTDRAPAAVALYLDDAWTAQALTVDARPPARSVPPPAPPPRPEEAKAIGSDGAVDPHIARQAALRDSAEFGMIGLFGASSGDVPDALTAPWGRLGSPPRADLYDDGPAWSSLRSRSDSRPHHPQIALRCDGGRALITWRQSHRDVERIHQVRCDAAGCAAKHADLDGLEVKSWWTAATLGETTVAIWRAEGGELRMRAAPLAQLPGAEDALLIDSHEYGGPSTMDLEVYSGNRAALVLFRGIGYHGLRIDAEGHFRAL